MSLFQVDGEGRPIYKTQATLEIEVRALALIVKFAQFSLIAQFAPIFALITAIK